MAIKMPLAPVVLVTGAANGIGKAIALGLFAQGMRVAAVDRDEQRLKELKMRADQVGRSSGFEVFTEDLSLFDAEALLRRVELQLGRVNILINNAGLGQGQIRKDYHLQPPKFYEVSPDQWAKTISVNASAVFYLSKAVIHSMLADGWGRIINVTTSLGTMLRGGYCPYGPTKAAAEGLSAVMAADLEGTGVTVNVLIPGGIVNTPMIPDDAPFLREELIQPEVMLPPLFWLCSEQADHVTGLRFMANKWNASVPNKQAAQIAGAPIGWKDIAVLPVTPDFKN